MTLSLPVLATAAALAFAEWFWLGDLALFFLPWIALAAFVAFAAFWIAGAAILTASFAMLLLVAGTVLATRYDAPPDWPESSPHLRIATFNTFISNADPDAIEAYVRSNAPDILVLQEVFGGLQADLRRRLADLYPHSAEIGEGAELDVLSRYPIATTEALAIDAGRGVDGSLIRVELTLNDGPAVLFAIHAPTPRFGITLWNRRNALLEQLAAAVAVEAPLTPVIVAGDFNTPPWSPHMSELLSLGGLAITSGRMLPSATRLIDRAGLPAGFGAPVDHVLVSEGIDWRPIEPGPMLGSDHRPMLVELRLPLGLR